MINLDTDHSGINYQNDDEYFEGIIHRLDLYTGNDKIVAYLDALEEQRRQ